MREMSEAIKATQKAQLFLAWNLAKLLDVMLSQTKATVTISWREMME
jgi:hypothetical protein